MKLFDGQGRPVLLGESVGRGGEAAVYTVKGRPGRLAKIFDPAPRPEYTYKLAWMLANPPENPTQSLEHPSLAWPSALLYDERRRLAGYLMPYIQVGVPILDVFNPRRRQEMLPSFNRYYLHRVARNLAAAVGALHQHRYTVGDLNESNILVTPAALVTLIDTDSFQVRERRDGHIVVHPCPVAKLEYTPPELQGKSLDKVFRLPEHDAFGLGVLIFQLLMEGNHPFRAQWLGKGEPPPIEARIASGAFPYTAAAAAQVLPPKNAPGLNLLHPGIAELVRRCFIDGHSQPRQRPSPAMWERAIAEAEKCMLECHAGHIYSSHLSSCPYCPQTARPAAPAKLSPFPRPAAPAPARQSQPASRGPAPQPARAAPASGSRPWARFLGNPYFGSPAPSTPLAGSPSRPNPASTPAARPLAFPGRAPASLSSWNRSRAALRRLGFWDWAKPRIYKSVAVGGALGALAGVLPGALIAIAGGYAGNAVAWALLFALGGASAAVLRGWRPSSRLGRLVNRWIGWERFWRGAGLIGGALVGGILGMTLAWMIFPIFIGLVGGAGLGAKFGEKIWLAGSRVGWDRLWTAFGTANAVLLGGGLAWGASLLGLGHLAHQVAGALSSWVGGPSGSLVLDWAIAGALGGAFGGAIAGTLTDLFARFSGLVD